MFSFRDKVVLHCFIVYRMIKLESNIYAVVISCDDQIVNEKMSVIDNFIATTIVYCFAIHDESQLCVVLCIDIYKPYQQILYYNFYCKFLLYSAFIFANYYFNGRKNHVN